MVAKKKRNVPIRFTNEKIIKALEKHYGLVSLAAKDCGCTPQLIYLRIREEEEVKEAVRLQRERLADKAEAKLRQAIDKGQSWAILKCLSSLRRDLYNEIARVHLGGDKDAPPVQQEVIDNRQSVLDLPIELQMQILAHLDKQKEDKK